MAADWSMLPSDPLGEIALRFTIIQDFIRFSAVCQGWNRAAFSIKHQWRPPFPSLLLAENANENSDGLRKIFNLNNNQIFSLKLPETFRTRCWGSPYGWIAMADDNRNVQLFNPITKARIHFPSFKSLKNYNEKKDALYKDDYAFFNVYLNKLIVLKVSQNDTYEFVIMVIYDNHYYVDFARHGDESWTPVSTKEFSRDPTWHLYTRITDIVAKNNHIFALYGDGSIVYWHAREFCSGELLIPTDYSPPGTYEIVSRNLMANTSKYLVESHGDLIMVVRYVAEIATEDFDSDIGYNDNDIGYNDIGYSTFAFEVFKLSEHKRWKKIEDLGNVALFVGANYSMSMTLGVDQCLQHNCVYFTDDESESWSIVREFGGDDTGFYDVRTDEIHFFKQDDMRSLFCRSTWFIPKF